mgnify:CR=1 FL=1
MKYSGLLRAASGQNAILSEATNGADTPSHSGSAASSSS